MAHTTVVPGGHTNVGQPSTDFAQNATSTLLTSQSGQDAPTTSETQTTGMSLIWKLLLLLIFKNHSKVKAFQNKLPTSSSNHGEAELSSSTKLTSTNGHFSVVKDKLIQFLPL